MPKLKPRENRTLDASEFAVHLDHIRLGRAHADYIQPKRFFDRTFFIQSLLDLSSRFDAATGYTPENTQLICESCDRDNQSKRGFK